MRSRDYPLCHGCREVPDDPLHPDYVRAVGVWLTESRDPAMDAVRDPATYLIADMTIRAAKQVHRAQQDSAGRRG